MNERLYQEIVTPQQLMLAVQDETVRSTVGLAIERESGLLKSEEFDRLKARLEELGIPSNSIHWVAYTCAEDIKLARGIERSLD